MRPTSMSERVTCAPAPQPAVGRPAGSRSTMGTRPSAAMRHLSGRGGTYPSGAGSACARASAGASSKQQVKTNERTASDTIISVLGCAAMATVFLKRGRANPLWQGHPWVYSGAIAREDGSYQPGDVVDVADAEGRYIGRGFVNPRSQIRVRMVTSRDEAVDGALIARRVQEAQGLRARLGFPSQTTNAYRLVNSEGDALPGVIVDVYGDVCAVQFTALGMKKREVEL